VSRDGANGEVLTFGLFDWLDDDGTHEVARLYSERLDMVEQAEALGFDIYHLAEHHGTPIGLATSPNVFLAAVAMRTERIRLCPLVYVLPLYNPIRLTEEIRMLDHLSHGRLEVGFGRGSSPYELGYYGVAIEDTKESFPRTLARVRSMMTDGGMAPGTEGEMSVPPLQRPHPPLWYPSSNPESIPRLGREGFNTILGFAFNSPPVAEVRQRRGEFFAGVQDAGADVPMGGAGAPSPRFGILRHVYVGETDAAARKEAVPALTDYHKNLNYVRTRHGVDVPELDFDALIEQGLALIGSAETVRDSLARLLHDTGANHFAGAFTFGSLPHEQARRSLQRFATEVLPATAPVAAEAD